MGFAAAARLNVVRFVMLALALTLPVVMTADAQALLVGNATTPRAAASDTATGVFYTNYIPITGDGTVATFNAYDQGSTNSFEVIQLRPTATPDEYSVAYRSGAIAAAGAAGGVSSYPLPGGPVEVQPGDIFAHYGRGIPFTQAGQVQDGNLQTNRVPIFFSVPSASIPVPNDGETLTLSTTTGASTLGPFPITGFIRDYATNVEYTPALDIAFVGNDLINRASNDGAGGSIFTLLDPVENRGSVTQFTFFDNDTPGRQMTPIILEDVGGTFEIRGIGTTRTSDGSGVQTFAFDLVAGSDEVKGGYFLAWKDGSNGGNNQGVADYADNISPFGVRWFGTQTSFAVGQNLGGGQFFNREYSVEYTLQTIPEPMTASLIMLTAPALLKRRRRS